MKELYWIGSSLGDMKRFPPVVRSTTGYALYLAQEGDKHPDAKPLKGFAGAGTLEVVINHQGDTYRAVYTVSFKDVVYVLHTFQKKSKRGIATPKPEMDLIKSRLKKAREHHGTLKGTKND